MYYWKKLIKKKLLKNNEMFIFINKYSKIDDSFFDENFINDITENINLNDLDKNKNLLEEYQKCNFLQKIDENKIEIFINGILNKIFTFTDYYYYLKYIFNIENINYGNENEKKYNEIINLSISKFNKLLNTVNEFKVIKIIGKIIKKIIIMSIINDSSNIIIQNINNSHIFKRDELINIYLDEFINKNDDININEEYEEKKEKIINQIIKNYINSFSLEDKIDFLIKVKNKNIRENLISYFPKLNYNDFFMEEENDLIYYLSIFIKKDIFNKKEIIKSTYFENLLKICIELKNNLINKKINFFEIRQLEELIKKNKLENRVECIELGNKNNSKKLISNIKHITEYYIKYYSILNIIIRYDNKYFPRVKKQEIKKYNQHLIDFKEAKVNMNEIEINENIFNEVKSFEKYENSKIFGIIYNNIENKSIKKEKLEKILNKNQKKNSKIYLKNKNLISIKMNDILKIYNLIDKKSLEIPYYLFDVSENYKFNKTINDFQRFEHLFDDEPLEIIFIKNIIDKLEESKLNNEILYLKEYFNKNNIDEQKIIEQLLFIKNKNKLYDSIICLMEMIKIFNIPCKSNHKVFQLDCYLSRIKYLEKFQDTSSLINDLLSIDDQILEKNF